MLSAAYGRAKAANPSVGYVGCGGTQPTLSAALAPCSLTFGRGILLRNISFGSAVYRYSNTPPRYVVEVVKRYIRGTRP